MNFQVVILSFNQPELTRRCVFSVLQFVAPTQVILVHNGTSSKNVARLQSQLSEIQHFCLAQNQHFSGGANAGLRFAFRQTNWILFLTNDCELLQLGPLPSQVGLWAPLIYARQRPKIDSLGGQLDPGKMKLAHCKSASEFSKASAQYIPGTAFWIHRQFFETSMGFDERFQTYWEDVDLSLRAARQGLLLALHPATEVLHHIGKTNHKNPHYTTYLFQRNRLRIARQYYPQLYLNRLAMVSDWLGYFLRFIARRDWQRVRLLKKAILDQDLNDPHS